MKEILQKKKNLIILCSIVYIISGSLFILLRIGSKFGWFAFLGDSVSYVLNLVNQILFIAGVPLLIFSLCKKQNLTRTLKDFRFSSIPGKVVGNSFLLGLIMFGIVVIISSIWGGLVSLTGYKSPLFSLGELFVSTNPCYEFLIGIVLTCLLPAFCEEILLRGCVLSGLEQMGRKRAIVICGLLFGLLHLNINQFAYASAMGMCLAMITLMTNSIWPAIIIHFTSNFCSVFSTFISKLNLFGGELNRIVSSIFQGNLISSFINITLISFLLIFLFIIVFAKIIKFSRSKMLYDKLQNVINNGKIKQGEKIEINDETGDALIEMRAIVENEIVSQMSNVKKPFDFILPPTEKDKYKPTKIEWFFVGLALAITGLATLIGFIGGIL